MVTVPGIAGIARNSGIAERLIEKPDPRPTAARMQDVRFACELIERESVRDLRG
jgi:hypothetical protein